MGISALVLILIGIIVTTTVVMIRQGIWQPSSPGSVPPPRKLPARRKYEPAAKPIARNKPGANSKPKVTPPNPHRAITIISGSCPCAAVTALESSLYLVEDRDVPELPLAACDAQKCECKYRHLSDRREDDDDRRTIASLRTQLHNQSGNDERRARKGRRKDDSPS